MITDTGNETKTEEEETRLAHSLILISTQNLLLFRHSLNRFQGCFGSAQLYEVND